MMTASKHGHQPAQRLGWATLAYYVVQPLTLDCTSTATAPLKSCEKVVEIRRKSHRVMTVVMALEEVVRIICVYGPQI